MIIGIDTGGTKTLISSFDDKGAMTQIARFPTPRDKKEYVHAVKEAIHTAVDVEEIRAIAVAIPGIIHEGRIIRCGNLDWRDVSVVALLRPYFRGVPIFTENDANLGGLGEVRLRNRKRGLTMYTTISTGIGCGVILNGAIMPGLRNMSESGHMLLDYDGMLRPWESFASGSAIMKRYKKLASDITSKRDWEHITDRMSRGFLVLLPVIQPDEVIIGGGVGTHFEKYGERLNAIIQERLPKEYQAPVVQAKYPEEAVAYGCYYYAKDCLARL